MRSGLLPASPMLKATLSAEKKPMPKLDWKFSNGGNDVRLTMSADPRPKTVLFWSASSQTKDFRQSKWTSQPVELKDGSYEGLLKTSGDGHAAVFGEYQFDHDGLKYSLTTQAYRN